MSTQRLEQELQRLWNVYRAAVFKPNAWTYEAELPRANWQAVWLGLLVVGVATALEYWLLALQTESIFRSLEDLVRSVDLDPAPIRFLWELSFWGGPVRGFVTPFITFFLGALFLLFMSRLFGGQPRNGNFRQDFLVHCYLQSLSYTPLRTLAGLITIIPLVGASLGTLIVYYQYYCSGVALQVARRMTWGRAQLAIWIPQVVLFLVSLSVSFLVAIYFFFTFFMENFSYVVTGR